MRQQFLNLKYRNISCEGFMMSDYECIPFYKKCESTESQTRLLPYEWRSIIRVT